MAPARSFGRRRARRHAAIPVHAPQRSRRGAETRQEADLVQYPDRTYPHHRTARQVRRRRQRGMADGLEHIRVHQLLRLLLVSALIICSRALG